MTEMLERILQSKRALRRDLAGRPIAEKLAMLEVLRERTRVIRAARPVSPAGQPPLTALEPPASRKRA